MRHASVPSECVFLQSDFDGGELLFVGEYLSCSGSVFPKAGLELEQVTSWLFLHSIIEEFGNCKWQ
jgi:hypothetical protein